MESAMTPEVSVVVPVHDEEGAAAVLAEEIAAAFAGRAHEIVFVDDASRDRTREQLAALKARLPQLRLLAHRRNAGQSRAVRTGVLAARGDIIVTLDGDGQNDPADAPRLVDRLRASGPELALVGGQRLKRQDTAAKRWASKSANGVRKRLLNDKADDTGCGLKVFRREAFLRLPYFDHMHRYLPALMLREGYEVAL
jgi:glycosyltransferase involved in cell wall biosynthesis